jgi:hypothetical protein
MKYRLIQRNDGKYQYEYGLKDTYCDAILWHRIDYLIFNDEQTARQKLGEIANFTKKADIAKVIEEIEL